MINKRFKLLFSLVLGGSLLLTGCNLPSSSGSDSVNSSSQTTTNQNVNSIVLSTESSLTQFIGLTSKVTINAKVNNQDSYSGELKWFVNDVLSLTQDGLVFELFPNEVKAYNIKASVGNVNSNVISLNVDLPSFTLSQVNAISPNVIEVLGDPGLSFSLSGLTISSNSSYNFVRGVYTLNLLSTMIQGNTYNITVSKPGFKNLVLPFTYENRKIQVGYLLYSNKRVVIGADGSYVVTKPFTAGSSANYTISVQHSNLEGNNVPVSITTNVPTGATAIAPFQSTTTLAKGINYNKEYTLTATSSVGLYTHNIQLGGLSLIVRVVVINPEPILDIGTPFIYDTPTFSNNAYVPIASPFAQDADGKYLEDEIKPDANGHYVITRPYNGLAKEFTFRVRADNFTTPLGFPAAPATPYNLITALSGPSGGVMFYGGTVNNLNTSLQFRETIGDSLRITQYVDNKTVVGTYNYTFTVTGATANRTKTITVVVREFAPTIEPIIRYNNQELKPNSDGTFTVYKPLGSNVLNGTITAKLSNFESPLITTVNPADGLDTYYNDGTALRFLLNYRVTYSGPLTSVAAQNSKIAVELGAAANVANPNSPATVASQTSPAVNYPRFIREGSSLEVDLNTLRDTVNYTSSSIFGNVATINANTFPGTHVYNIQIGRVTRQLIFRVVDPQALLFTDDDIVQYGPVANAATKNNVTLNKDDGKYYVNGVGGFVKVNVSPFGMPTGSYPYTFTTKSPSGIFQSNTNVVALTINDNPYTGALLYPQSGAGSEMRVVQQLSEEGEYTFNFNINGLVKEVQVVVMPSPQLKLLAASINDESISSFNSIYYVNHAASDRFVELSLQAVNVKDTFSYVVSSTGEFPSGEALNAAKNPLVIVEGGKTSIGVTLPARNINNLTTPEQNTYIITLYDGNTRVGSVTKIVIISEPVRSSILFNSNGGTVRQVITGFVGVPTSSVFPANPSRDGFSFNGWFTDPTLTVAYTGTAFPANDIVLFAKWTAIP
jgi:uncharacterized repeat protein (TIGR02543 family)